jgi:hypothetical protein
VRRVILSLAFVVLGIDAAAQTPQQTYQDMWNRRIDAIKKIRDDASLDLIDKIGREVSPNLNITGFLLFAHAQTLTRELRLIEGTRTDKQLGSPATTAGSTSLVSRGPVPSILAFAVEHGALTQTSNATSATVRGNAVGWLDLLKEQDFISSYDDDSGAVRALRKISYSLTFNTETGAAPAESTRPDPAALKEQVRAAGRQLASYSVRLTLIDLRDPRRRENRASVAKFVDTTGVDLSNATMFLDPVLVSPDYDRWLSETQVALSAPGAMSKGDIERVLYQRLEALRLVMEKQIPNFAERVAGFVNAFNAFETARTGLFDMLQKKFVMAAELVRTRPVSVPASSTFRVVADGLLPRGGWNITGNFAVTHQDSGTVLVPDPRETRGWRDLQLALQAERPLGKVDPCSGGGVGRPALAFEYLLQDLREKATVSFGGHQFAVEKGRIHVAQAKVTIPMKGSGIKLPLSISFANRTELLKEKNVRGHIGMTFDLDALVAAVRR